MLPPDLLRDLLTSDGLSVGSELDVAQAALLWAAADLRTRAPLLPQLLPAARMPPARLAEEAAAAGLLGGGAEWQLQQALAGRCSPSWQPQPQHQQQQQQQKAEEPPPQAPATPQQGGVSELGHAFIHACQVLQHGGSGCSGAAAAGCSSGLEAAVVVYRPRLSCPTGLMLAGGLDDGWRPLR